MVSFYQGGLPDGTVSTEPSKPRVPAAVAAGPDDDQVVSEGWFRVDLIGVDIGDQSFIV